MPNLLAGKNVVPEFIQHDARPDQIASAVLVLLENPEARDQMTGEFDQVIRQLGQGGANESAAAEILAKLNTAS
jgi:lipid-A-disaccharide synthase